MRQALKCRIDRSIVWPGLGVGVMPESLMFSNMFRHFVDILGRCVVRAGAKTHQNRGAIYEQNVLSESIHTGPSTVRLVGIEKFLKLHGVVGLRQSQHQKDPRLLGIQLH